MNRRNFLGWLAAGVVAASGWVLFCALKDRKRPQFKLPGGDFCNYLQTENESYTVTTCPVTVIAESEWQI